MNRRLLPLVLALLAVLAPAGSALADLAPPILIRWSERPQPAHAGVETVGRLELRVVRPGIVEDFAIDGDGWTVRGVDAAGRIVLPRDSRRTITFRAVPTDPTAPIVVTGTISGRPFREEFRLDAAYLDRLGRPGAVRAVAPPVLSGTKAPGATTNGGARNIRFHGRFMYERLGGGLVGGDNIVVRVMDDDSPGGDEEIGRFLTDPEGNFDQTISWDDCDLTGCDDPDIYLIYEAANLVVEMRTDDTEEMYVWNNEAAEITDFTGSDVDFGLQIAAENPQAIFIYNAIIRAHRYANQYGGMNGAHTFCNWPAGSTGASYSDDFNRIRIGTNQEWIEGTIMHEYGHRLSEQFSVLDDPNYDNEFCDNKPDGPPGHCVWCPETAKDAWQEGWANWFGDWGLRQWAAEYDDVPLSINDGRYNLELTQNCTPGVSYPSNLTEGFAGALVRDIEDSTNEDDDLGLPDCSMDVLADGAGEIFAIFRDYDPETVNDFINAYRVRHVDRDSDLWTTIQNVAPALGFPQPTPRVKTQPAKCRTIRQGESFTLTAEGDGALYTYQWRRDGVPFGNGAGFNGAQTKSLTFNPITVAMEGTYDCVVTTCDGSMNVTSQVARVEVQLIPGARAYLAWGENGSGQVGDGTTSISRPATVHPNMQDIIEVDGGRSFSMALRRNGRLLTWGLNNFGELGHGFMPQLNTPTEIASLDDVVRIAAGKYYALALKRDGSIWSWGWGLYGQLFTGAFDGRGVPGSTVPLPGCVRDIAAADEHSLALLEDGTVWAVGYNEYGNLGRGFSGPRDAVAQAVPGLTNVVAIDASYHFNVALKADGTVWTWGINTWGQLGLGHFNTVTSPTQVPGLANIVQISAGLDNTYARRSDGVAFAAGYGPALGQGWTGGASPNMMQIPLTNITEIRGGGGYAAALIGGRLKAWGNNVAVSPPDVGVFNTTHNYITGSPVDVPQVGSITAFGAAWGTLHAIGLPEIVDVPTEQLDAPAVLALAATPNPAHATASIRFDLPTAGHVALAVYDVAGRVVRTLADEAFEPGRHARNWDGGTNAGTRATAGVYFVRMVAPGGTITRTLVRID